MKRRRTSFGLGIGAPFKKPRKTEQLVTIARPLTLQRNTVGLGPEKKNLDINATGGSGISAGIGRTWTLGALLNAIPQGNTEVTRIGRKVQMVSLDLIWTAGVVSAASINGGSMRIKIVYDKQTNLSAAAVTDVLAVDDFGSANNLSNSDRFITVADWITDPFDTDGPFEVSGKIKRKLALDTMFTGVGGTIAAVTTGALFIMIAQSGGVDTTGPLFQFYSRVRFIDI